MFSEPQATQVNLLRHQRTELPPANLKKKRKAFRSKQTNHKYQQEERQDEREPQVQRKFKHVHTSQEDRCTRCGDTPHIEGFRCPASRHQCKYCHKFGHFSQLSFKMKQESEYKGSSRKPKAHQLMVGRYSTESSLSEQTDTNMSSSEENSFCLQMKSKYVHTKKKCSEPLHLATNPEYKLLKPQKRRTKFLRARIDTCSNVNMMPISVYCLIYKDPNLPNLPQA